MSSPASRRSRTYLVGYFTIAYMVTWCTLVPLALASHGVLAIKLPAWWHAVGALGPLLAAFVATRMEGDSATRAWLQSFTRWRVGVTWWLIALASPLVLLLLSAVAARAFGAPPLDVTRLRAPEYANPTWLFDLLFVGTFAYGIGEEPGWRGYALPRLQDRFGPLAATLLLTPLWAIFHWPAFFYRASYQGGMPTVVGFLFGLLAGAIVLTFLYNGTGRSLPVVIVWHALINIALQVASVLSQPVVAIMNVLIASWAIAITVWWIRNLAAPARLHRSEA